jgi:hypothetical protein
MLKPLESFDFEEKRKEVYDKIFSNGLEGLTPSISNPFIHEIVERNYRKYFNSDPKNVMGLFNDFGQRCDDFKTNHDAKLHVLYSGCSFTYAEGVPIDLSWSGIVNKYINKNLCETSGYFNVAKGGSNFKDMENHIFAYMKYSGKPDVIFINIPEIGREYLEYRVSLRTLNDNTNSKPSIKDELITIESFRNRLLNFKRICDMLNIQLFIGCWTMNSTNYWELSSEFKNPFVGLDVINVGGTAWPLHSYDNSDLGYPEIKKQIIDDVGENSPLLNIIHLALDDAHPGLLGHRIMADCFIKAIEQRGLKREDSL